MNVLVAACLGAALAAGGAVEGDSPPMNSSAPSLERRVQEAPIGELGALLRQDERARGLGPGERAALLASTREPWRPWASAANVFPGFGLGSHLQRDWRGWILTGVDAVGVGLVVAGGGRRVLDHVACGVVGQRRCPDDPQARNLRVAGLGVWLAGRIAGAILPATWPGRRFRAVERGLDELPAPSASAVLVPFAAAGGGLVPGATIAATF